MQAHANALRGVFFCRSTTPHTHTHTARKYTQTQKRLADCRRCNTTFRECKPTTANENTTESKVATPLFESVSRPTYDHYNAVALCCTLTSQYLSHSRKASGFGHHRVYTTPDKSTAVNRRRCIERYPPRRYVSNDIPPTTG